MITVSVSYLGTSLCLLMELAIFFKDRNALLESCYSEHSVLIFSSFTPLTMYDSHGRLFFFSTASPTRRPGPCPRANA